MISSGRVFVLERANESVHHRGGGEPAQQRRRVSPALLRLDGGPSRLQRIRAFAHESEREADDRPEQRILVAAALGGERPAVAYVAQIGREEQVNPEKERNPSRIDRKS